MKFLAFSKRQIHTGDKFSYDWREKDNASVFTTNNLSFEVKKSGGSKDQAKEIDRIVIASFKVNLLRKVEILQEQS